jgi:hypothetical protein
MPPEYYIGIAIAAILVVLLGMFLQRWLGTRFVVLHKSSGTDQLANQLSRIADSLEKLVVQSGASQVLERKVAEQPAIEKAAVAARKAPEPAQNPPEPNASEPPKTEKPAEHHVSFSMFGR